MSTVVVLPPCLTGALSLRLASNPAIISSEIFENLDLRSGLDPQETFLTSAKSWPIFFIFFCP